MTKNRVHFQGAKNNDITKNEAKSDFSDSFIMRSDSIYNVFILYLYCRGDHWSSVFFCGGRSKPLPYALHVREANISHLRSKYFIAQRFHLPVRANFIGAPAIAGRLRRPRRPVLTQMLLYAHNYSSVTASLLSSPCHLP